MLTEGIAGEIRGEQREFVETIHEKGRQLLELITGLLDLSKLESGTSRMLKSEVVLDKLVRDVIQTLMPMALQKGVVLTGRVDPGIPMLLGDPVRLRQVLINLSENALKFTPEGGEITISAGVSVMDPVTDSDEGMILLAAKRPAARLVVADSGIGIPDEEKKKVFDPFYQVDSGATRDVGGTGLGLSIVKRLVEGHEGRIHVEDNSPAGTAFVVMIPLRNVTLS